MAAPEQIVIDQEEETLGPQTKRILKRVYGWLRREDATPASANKNSKYRFFKLTGLNEKVLSKLSREELVNMSDSSVDRAELLRHLHNCYINSKTMPTTLILFNLCQHLLPVHMDLAGFRKLLFKLDFVWKKIPRYTFVVLEKPEVTYERFMFLKSILDQDQSEHVYFIEENCLDDSNGGNFYDFCKSLELEGTTKKVIYAMSRTKIILNSKFEAEYTEKSFKHWITDELLPYLQKPSVIVFNNAEHHCEMLPRCSDLTIESLRCEMTDWLDRNNIPYEETMSKVELFTLIETFTDKFANKYQVDNILLTAGHIPVRLPNYLISLTPGQYLHQLIQNHIKRSEGLSSETSMDGKVYSLLMSVNPDMLKEYFRDVFGEYKRIFDQDLQVDQCLDGLMLKMDKRIVTSDKEDSDLPSMSDDSD